MVIDFDTIDAVVSHFTCTNFVRVGNLVGRELFGVPMGDALSCAALRLFK